MYSPLLSYLYMLVVFCTSIKCVQQRAEYFNCSLQIGNISIGSIFSVLCVNGSFSDFIDCFVLGFVFGKYWISGFEYFNLQHILHCTHICVIVFTIRVSQSSIELFSVIWAYCLINRFKNIFQYCILLHFQAHIDSIIICSNLVNYMTTLVHDVHHRSYCSLEQAPLWVHYSSPTHLIFMVSDSSQ